MEARKFEKKTAFYLFAGIILILFIAHLILSSNYIPYLDRGYYDSNLFPVSLWNRIKQNDWYLYGLFALDGFLFLFVFIFCDYILSSRNKAIREPNEQRVSGWIRLQCAFKWKGVDNGYPSGEKTLYKLKMSALFSFFAVCLVAAITPFILWDYNMPEIIDELKTAQVRLDVDEIIAVASWAGASGLFYIISHGLFWFYIGRILSYFAISRRYSHFQNRPFFSAISSDPMIAIAIYSLRIFGWLCSLVFSIPFFVSLFTWDFSYGYWIFGGIAFLSLLLFIIISGFLLSNPKTNKIEPTAFPISQEAEKIHAVLKNLGTKMLMTITVGISIVNGWIWFASLGVYSKMVDWFDSGFYLFFGLLITVGPVLLLFHLRSVYARRVLLVYFLIIIAVLARLLYKISVMEPDLNYLPLSFILGMRVGRAKIIDYFSGAEKPIQIASTYALLAASVLCIIILRNSVLSISVEQPSSRRFQLIESIKKFFKQGPKLFESENIRFGRKQQFFASAIIALIIMSGFCIMLLQEDRKIILQRPQGHSMKVNIWDGGLNLPNSTLQVLGSNNITLLGWFDGTDITNAIRYAEYNVKVMPVIHFPTNASDWWSRTQSRAIALMDFWEANGLNGTPFSGFVFDIEKWRFITQYNESNYNQIKQQMRNFTEYAVARGYFVQFTNYLNNIGDLYDEDEDVSILNLNPADYTLNLGNGYYDWMIYRSENAIDYNEPHAYFTYHWGLQVKNYMKSLGGDELFKKASMSLGVIDEKMPLYIGERGLEQFLMDAAIAHALEFSAIHIFAFDGILDLWGLQGLLKVIEHLNTYQRIEIPYKLRASVLGNLKMEQNPTGSMFGFIYQDIWLEQDFELLLVSIGGLVSVLPPIITFLSIKKRKKPNHASNIDSDLQTSPLKRKEMRTIRILAGTLLSQTLLILIMSVYIFI